MSSSQASPGSPGWIRLTLCFLYESLLLIAILMFVALVYLSIFGDSTMPPKRYFFQFYLWLISASYFVWNWVRGGQTLAMQTWRIKLVSRAGLPPSAKQAMQRYVLATVFFGLSFVWALFDREGLTLHDRLSGTRLVLADKKT